MNVYDKTPNLNTFASKLAEKAWFAGHMIGCPHEANVRHAVERGEEIPERYKPGRFIMSLKAREKEIVKKLKAEHFNDRLFG